MEPIQIIMTKLYPKLLFLLLPFFVQSQLYVQKNTSAGSSDNAYIYNKGEILFVTKDINLKDGAPNIKSGNIYLRDEGQLLQGDDTSVNKGTGIVSVYQEGTVNQWDYHFWAMPVSDPLGSTSTPSGNSGNLISNLNGSSSSGNSGKGGGIFSATNILESDPAVYVSAPDNYNGIKSANSVVVIADYWIRKYAATTGYSGWQLVSKSGELLPGEGYSMKGVNGGSGTTVQYDFRGRPNNGTIKVEVGRNQNTLVGNPYPSAMDLNFYLLSNSKPTNTALDNCKIGAKAIGERITGTAYFWESDPSIRSHFLSDYQGGYGTYSPVACNTNGTYARPTHTNFKEDGTTTGSGMTPTGTIGRQYAPVGQGFFVKGSDKLTGSGPHYVEARNVFRIFKKENLTSSTFRKAEKRQKQQKVSLKHQNFDPETGKLITPELRISTKINNIYARELVTVFYDEATEGIDLAADGRNISFLATDVSYLIDGSEEPYNINVLPYNENLQLTLTVSAGNKTNEYEMQVSTTNYDSDGVWLWDKEHDLYHDIQTISHAFSLPKGEYNNRFFIVFKDKEEVLGLAEKVKNSLDVFQNNKDGQLEVINPLHVELREIAVYDIVGKQVSGKLNAGTDRKTIIASSSWTTGVYLVRVLTQNHVEYTKKISVVNK